MASSEENIDLATPVCNLVLWIFKQKKNKKSEARGRNYILLLLFFILEIKIMRRAITIKINVYF